MPNNRKFKSLVSVLVIFLNIFFLSVADINAQLDPTFGTNGVAIGDSGHSDLPLASFVLPNGKILVVSRTACCPFPNGLSFLRFNADGPLDSTYGTNGVISIAIPYSLPNSGEINGAARQPDGKIVLVGSDNTARGIILRYNEDGTLDTSFANGGIDRPNTSINNDDGLNSVLIQPDGKILVAGFASFGGNYPNLSILRYFPNGTIDTSIGTSGNGFIFHTSIVLPFDRGSEIFSLMSNGSFIVGNRYETNTGGTYPSRTRIYKFNADGSMDNNFTVLSYGHHNTIGTLLTAAVQPDDKILVGNQVTKTDPLEIVHNDAQVSRHNPDGTFDTSFGNGGVVSFYIGNYVGGYPRGIQVQPDGQILVAVDTTIFPNRGSYRNSWLTLFRLSSTGTVNGKFLATKFYGSDKIFISILPDGKILTTNTGYSPADSIMLVRATGVPFENHLFRSIPFNFSSAANGYAYAKPSVFRTSDRTFRIYPTSDSFFGLSDDIPVPSDYISSYTADVAVFRPSNGTWYIAKTFDNAATNFLAIRWGTAGDVPAPADYNGDGKSDVAVFRPSDGTWYIYYIVDGSYTIQPWGLNGDKPTPGDYDGDGRDDIGVFRPSEGNWYIQRSSDGGYTILHFGLDGDIPVQEDYDGDGKFDIAVYRPSNGVWYRLNSSDGSFSAYQWGLAGDVPVPGNYNGDGKSDIAVWRPSNGGWYIYYPEINQMSHYTWGTPTDLPLPAKF